MDCSKFTSALHTGRSFYVEQYSHFLPSFQWGWSGPFFLFAPSIVIGLKLKQMHLTFSLILHPHFNEAQITHFFSVPSLRCPSFLLSEDYGRNPSCSHTLTAKLWLRKRYLAKANHGSPRTVLANLRRLALLWRLGVVEIKEVCRFSLSLYSEYMHGSWMWLAFKGILPATVVFLTAHPNHGVERYYSTNTLLLQVTAKLAPASIVLSDC